MLADALQKQFAPQHLMFTYRAFHSAADLPTDQPTIALIRYKLFVDHYVTVLQSANGRLTIGDPLDGIRTESFADFEKDWRRVGIAVSRK